MKRFELLKKHFGYESFRLGQEAVIDKLMSGKDVMAIMPTGGGKSLCYQLPALMVEGVTLVISPLIALMKDQVDGLNENGIPATFINSSLSASETNERVGGILRGDYRLVYVAPERLLSESFYQLTRRLNIALVAVDEAHCISQWGHDFRPSYRDIPQFIMQLPKRPTLAAFTATATPYVVEEIKSLLDLQRPFELITGFDRPNLFYQVVKPTDKIRYIKEYITQRADTGSGIIYCATRKSVESLSDKLKGLGFKAAAYHAGMDNASRSKVQEAFMLDRIRVIVATNAFGMGIDKPDVRFVIHYNMPKNMEAYYQEAGRAGRDGEPSDCILMYSPSDIIKQKLMIQQNQGSPERDQVQRENLQTLVNYCHTNDCLRREIIQYFGEPVLNPHCGSCGNCQNEDEFVDMTLESQKILSCIYRTNQRFGVNMIIDVLRGSKNKKILDWGLDQVSTYGIITDHSEGGLRELMMNLIARGFIAMTTDQFPVLKLQETAKQVLKGNEKILIRKERMHVQDKKKKGAKRKTDLSLDHGLFELLADKRRSIAEEKHVPLYVIFHNSALEEMAYYMPTTKEQFLAIKGVGEKKFDNYGSYFIQVIKAFITDQGLDQKIIVERELAAAVVLETVESKPTQNRYELTYALYVQNLSLEVMSEKRELAPSTIVTHLKKLSDEGKDIQWQRFLDLEKEEMIREVIKHVGRGSLKAIKANLPETVSYTDIHLTLACNEEV